MEIKEIRKINKLKKASKIIDIAFTVFLNSVLLIIVIDSFFKTDVGVFLFIFASLVLYGVPFFTGYLVKEFTVEKDEQIKDLE